MEEETVEYREFGDEDANSSGRVDSAQRLQGKKRSAPKFKGNVDSNPIVRRVSRRGVVLADEDMEVGGVIHEEVSWPHLSELEGDGGGRDVGSRKTMSSQSPPRSSSRRSKQLHDVDILRNSRRRGVSAGSRRDGVSWTTPITTTVSTTTTRSRGVADGHTSTTSTSRGSCGSSSSNRNGTDGRMGSTRQRKSERLELGRPAHWGGTREQRVMQPRVAATAAAAAARDTWRVSGAKPPSRTAISTHQRTSLRTPYTQSQTANASSGGSGGVISFRPKFLQQVSASGALALEVEVDDVAIDIEEEATRFLPPAGTGPATVMDGDGPASAPQSTSSPVSQAGAQAATAGSASPLANRSRRSPPSSGRHGGRRGRTSAFMRNVDMVARREALAETRLINLCDTLSGSVTVEPREGGGGVEVLPRDDPRRTCRYFADVSVLPPFPIPLAAGLTAGQDTTRSLLSVLMYVHAVHPGKDNDAARTIPDLHAFGVPAMVGGHKGALGAMPLLFPGTELAEEKAVVRSGGADDPCPAAGERERVDVDDDPVGDGSGVVVDSNPTPHVASPHPMGGLEAGTFVRCDLRAKAFRFMLQAPSGREQQQQEQQVVNLRLFNPVRLSTPTRPTFRPSHVPPAAMDLPVLACAQCLRLGHPLPAPPPFVPHP